MSQNEDVFKEYYLKRYILLYKNIYFNQKCVSNEVDTVTTPYHV